MSPRTKFHCETTSSACFLGDIQRCIYALCDSLLIITNQMVLSFKINILAGYILEFLISKDNFLFCTRLFQFSRPYIQLVREASLRNYSLSIFYVQFYFLLSVFYFYYYLFLLLFKAQTDIKAITVLFKTIYSAI